ncbi:MAG: GMP reductase, partial [Deltaproteobacteria bacterium]|nr:GMP reductase [Deltaproteobacteria bacterium]
MRIESDLKLGFKDVLIRPKRSTLKSRAQVNLDRTFTFLHSRREWKG